jgi:hypothetical protein
VREEGGRKADRPLHESSDRHRKLESFECWNSQVERGGEVRWVGQWVRVDEGPVRMIEECCHSRGRANTLGPDLEPLLTEQAPTSGERETEVKRERERETESDREGGGRT